MTNEDRNSILSSRQLAALVVDASPAGMVIADSEGRIVLMNPQARAWFGYTEAEVLGQPIEILIPSEARTQHVHNRKSYAESPYARPMARGKDLYAQRKDGSKFPVDISLHPISDGDKRMVLANIVDATSRHEAEHEREKRQGLERLALLGQLAGGVAHEIRTPLCIIGNDIYFLEMQKDSLSEEAQDCLAEIKGAVDRANRIVSELLDFTRETASNTQVCSVKAIIDGAIRLADLPPSVELEIEDSPHFDVDVDSDQIERILVNLLNNACQAMDRNGEIRLTTRLEDDTVVLCVSDSGPGIAEDVRERIFEPLFTTKITGIGLGLAVSRRYAQQNGGSIELVESNEGGSTFQLKLPAVTAGVTNNHQPAS